VTASRSSAGRLPVVPGDIPGFGVLCSGHGDADRGWRVSGGWGTLIVDDYRRCRDHYEKVGIGADYIDKLFR
jgi:hypothetical protein